MKGKRLLRVRGAAKLEARLERKAREALASGAEPALWQSVVKRRPKGMAHADYWTFRMLHRQFGGRRVPGLPWLVRAARAVTKGLRRSPLGRA